jgi:hypothetical protein
VKVDAVEKRPADLVELLLDNARSTDAVFVGMIVIAARTGVHTGDQHEIARKFDGHFRPGNGHFSFFQWLAHYF